jgi:hypothetical protein
MNLAARRFGSNFLFVPTALDRHSGSPTRVYLNHKYARPPAKITSQTTESWKYKVSRFIQHSHPMGAAN